MCRVEEKMGVWEEIYNPDFNYGKLATIKSQAGSNRFIHKKSQQAVGKISSQALLQSEKSFGQQAVAQLTQISWEHNTAIISRCRNPRKVKLE
jgi:hypothetical protein